MTQAMLAAAVLIASGRATRYGEHVMDVVVANREMWHQIDPEAHHHGYVALLDCSRVGDLVWLEHAGKVGGPYMVADCAAARDRDRLKSLGFAVDLSWELAQEWNVIDGPVEGFKVWSGHPAVRSGPVEM